MALFQFWNLNLFENPFPVSREEVLRLCKIRTLNTYHNCLHDLNQWGYIKYQPSFNPMTPSLITIHDLETVKMPKEEKSEHNPGEARIKNRTADNTTLGSKTIQLPYNPRLKNSTADHTGLTSLIKQYKQYKQINERGKNSRSKKSGSENVKKKKPDLGKRKKIAPKKEKVENPNPSDEKSNPDLSVPPTLDQVLNFFTTETYPEPEAQKFFNHYQSNGWKIAGKTPMEDWQASAHKWILNTQNFNTQPKPKPSPTNLNKNKRYDIPL
jgi:hypothetical protein